MKYTTLSYLTFLTTTLLMLGCSSPPKQKATEATETNQTATTTSSNWITLFDGTTLDGWRGFNMDSLPPNWTLDGNTLKSLGTGGDLGGDIIYANDQFDNFELAFEWKISEAGNSGVFYHVAEGPQYKAPYETGPEYQVIDDLGFLDPLEDWQKVGADYAMYVPEPGTKQVKPAGTWNTSRIIYTPEKASYWLNGNKLLEFVPYSEDWEARRNSGKWDDFPDYGKFKTGYIAIQDHGSFIWYRNIKIKKL